MFRGKRGATPEAIGILVILIVFLYSYALFNFGAHFGSFGVQVYSSRVVEDAYTQQSRINFYVDMIGNEAVKKINSNEDIKGDFIKYFKEELDKYKISGDKFSVAELNQIYSQLKPENVEIENDKIMFNLHFNIHQEAKKDNMFFIASVDYNYGRQFSWDTNFS